MSKRLAIRKLGRVTPSGELETLVFLPGVNVIVGPQNAGKTTWLRMLDYLMGEPESAAEKFDDILVRKYRTITATLAFDDETFELERHWNEDGRRAFFSLNGERIAVDDVQSFFLDRLSIPELRYPQGNIRTSDRTWPTLGWRSLFRHIYRRQNFWSDFVPQQPESEQHACLLQFLGLAEHLFAKELSELVDKQKQIVRLQNRKEYFVEILQQIAPDLTSDRDAPVGITAQSIDVARARLDSEIEGLAEKRSSILDQVRKQAERPSDELNNVMDERLALQHERSVLQSEIRVTASRLEELEDYRSNLQKELERLDRADAASFIFDGIRVTHCPACDQSVEDRPHLQHRCFLCGQSTSDGLSGYEAAAKRLEFERSQVSAEILEADELLSSVQADRDVASILLEAADLKLQRVEAKLRPFQARVAGVIPEEIALLDQKIGALNAKLEALERLHDPLKTRDALTQQIENLESEVRRLDIAISEQESKAEFAVASDRLTDGFNTYLNTIRNLDAASWTKSGAVSVRLTERRAQYMIGGRPAKVQLGGTLTIFFLFAYHYALLNLTRLPDAHYPGLSILDFFPDIAKGDAVSDRLSLVLAPFAELTQDEDFGAFQVIATSRTFQKQANVNLIHLSEVWR